MVISPPKCSSFLKQPGQQRFWKVLPTKGPDYPYSVSLSGSRTRSLVSCVRCLCVSTAGLSRDGFTLKGGIGSIRSQLRNSFAHTQTNGSYARSRAASSKRHTANQLSSILIPRKKPSPFQLREKFPKNIKNKYKSPFPPLQSGLVTVHLPSLSTSEPEYMADTTAFVVKRLFIPLLYTCYSARFRYYTNSADACL